MIILFLYTEIACIDAADMISRIRASEEINNQTKVELVEVIQEATSSCLWDAID